MMSWLAPEVFAMVAFSDRRGGMGRTVPVAAPVRHPEQVSRAGQFGRGGPAGSLSPGGGSVTHPEIRASDEDRRRVVAALERHTAAGRLSLDEFSERVGLVYAAATHGELARVTRDLPLDETAAPAADPAPRQLLVALLLSAVTIAVLAVLLALLH